MPEDGQYYGKHGNCDPFNLNFLKVSALASLKNGFWECVSFFWGETGATVGEDAGCWLHTGVALYARAQSAFLVSARGKMHFYQ